MKVVGRLRLSVAGRGDVAERVGDLGAVAVGVVAEAGGAGQGVAVGLRHRGDFAERRVVGLGLQAARRGRDRRATGTVITLRGGYRFRLAESGGHRDRASGTVEAIFGHVAERVGHRFGLPGDVIAHRRRALQRRADCFADGRGPAQVVVAHLRDVAQRIGELVDLRVTIVAILGHGDAIAIDHRVGAAKRIDDLLASPAHGVNDFGAVTAAVVFDLRRVVERIGGRSDPAQDVMGRGPILVERVGHRDKVARKVVTEASRVPFGIDHFDGIVVIVVDRGAAIATRIGHAERSAQHIVGGGSRSHCRAFGNAHRGGPAQRIDVRGCDKAGRIGAADRLAEAIVGHTAD